MKAVLAGAAGPPPRAIRSTSPRVRSVASGSSSAARRPSGSIQRQFMAGRTSGAAATLAAATPRAGGAEGFAAGAGGGEVAEATSQAAAVAVGAGAVAATGGAKSGLCHEQGREGSAIPE